MNERKEACTFGKEKILKRNIVKIVTADTLVNRYEHVSSLQRMKAQQLICYFRRFLRFDIHFPISDYVQQAGLKRHANVATNVTRVYRIVNTHETV